MNELLCQLSSLELQSALKRRIKTLERQIEEVLEDNHTNLEERQRRAGILQHKLLFARTRLRLLNGAKMPELAKVNFYQTNQKK
ncbi:MAG: hypothetical protein IPM52_13340 [Bacteroidetes bacterium]|nr:hypothetical protein [Bacteroidota bacterium]